MSTTSAIVMFTSGSFDGSGVNWTNASNLIASDDSRATAALSAGNPNSEVLHGSGLALNIPPEAEVFGIEALMEWRFTNGGNVNADSVRLENNLVQVAGSDDKAGPTALPADTDAVSTFGSSTDKWNAKFNLAADLLARNFGIGMSVLRATGSPQAEVDQISARVHYNVPGRYRTRPMRRWAYGHR